jgi:CheY-like chemotaxis protein
LKILFLDDDLQRHRAFKNKFPQHDTTYVETAEAAIECFKNNEYDVACLDHDLGGRAYVNSFGEESTGYTVAKWLSENPDRQPNAIYIHSFNPVGAANMHSLLPNSIIQAGIWLTNRL